MSIAVFKGNCSLLLWKNNETKHGVLLPCALKDTRRRLMDLSRMNSQRGIMQEVCWLKWCLTKVLQKLSNAIHRQQFYLCRCCPWCCTGEYRSGWRSGGLWLSWTVNSCSTYVAVPNCWGTWVCLALGLCLCQCLHSHASLLLVVTVREPQNRGWTWGHFRESLFLNENYIITLCGAVI